MAMKIINAVITISSASVIAGLPMPIHIFAKTFVQK
jgi:hypothetical protein